MHSMLHKSDNLIVKVAFSEFPLGLSQFLFSQFSTCTRPFCTKQNVDLWQWEAEKASHDYLNCYKDGSSSVVFVSWKGDVLWNIQDESTVVLDKYGLRSLTKEFPHCTESF